MQNDIYLNTIKKSVRDIQDILSSRVLLVAAAKTRLPNEVKAKIPNVGMRFLSMGMSNSYIIAIAKGANIVRIGTILFDERK